jgi:selenocysteine-specific elongation factor
MFHKNIEVAKQGDRAAMNLVSLNAKDLERGLICSPGSLQIMKNAIVCIQRVRYYKGSCRSDSQFHITVLHSTVMATGVFFFEEPDEKAEKSESSPMSPSAQPLSFEKEYKYLVEYERTNPKTDHRTIYAYLTFETPLVCHPGAIVIGSRMDADVNQNSCRLAFHGNILQNVNELSPNGWPVGLKVMTNKERRGRVDRINDDYVLIGVGLFKKETDLSKFDGMKVTVQYGELRLAGRIEGAFGKTGKFKVRIPSGGLQAAANSAKGKSDSGVDDFGVIILGFKKMMRIKDNKMYQ